MTKSEAIAIFGSQSDIARALRVSRSYVSQWPEELEEKIADRVRGAAVRLGLLAAGVEHGRTPAVASDGSKSAQTV